MHYFESLTGLLWAFLGAFGGIVKVLVQLLGSENLPSSRRIIFLLLANSVVSGFAGYIGAVFMSQVTDNDNYHVIAAGIFGYMGVAALDYFPDVLTGKLKLFSEQKDGI